MEDKEKTYHYPEVTGKRRETAIITFKHFAMRLAERYNVFITFEHYLMLNRLYLRQGKVIKGNDNRLVNIGYLKINEIDVLVLRGFHGPNLLLTALPINSIMLKRQKHSFKNGTEEINTNSEGQKGPEESKEP